MKYLLFFCGAFIGVINTGWGQVTLKHTPNVDTRKHAVGVLLDVALNMSRNVEYDDGILHSTIAKNVLYGKIGAYYQYNINNKISLRAGVNLGQSPSKFNVSTQFKPTFVGSTPSLYEARRQRSPQTYIEPNLNLIYFYRLDDNKSNEVEFRLGVSAAIFAIKSNDTIAAFPFKIENKQNGVIQDYTIFRRDVSGIQNQWGSVLGNIYIGYRNAQKGFFKTCNLGLNFTFPVYQSNSGYSKTIYYDVSNSVSLGEDTYRYSFLSLGLSFGVNIFSI